LIVNNPKSVPHGRHASQAILVSSFATRSLHPSVVENYSRTRTVNSGFERAGEGTASRTEPFVDLCARQSAIIRLVASLSGHDVTNETPYRQRRAFPLGAAFEGSLPPVVTRCFCNFRKSRREGFSRWGDLCRWRERCAPLMQRPCARPSSRAAHPDRCGTGVRQTTLRLNGACCRSRQNKDRASYLGGYARAPMLTRMIASRLRTQPSVSMPELGPLDLDVCGPDRIALAKCAAVRLLDLLKAWSTGHPAAVSDCARQTVRNGLDRLETARWPRRRQWLPRKLNRPGGRYHRRALRMWAGVRASRERPRSVLGCRI